MVRDLAVPFARNPGSRVLDLGCADRPYVALFPAGVEYVGADLPGNPLADVLINEDGTCPLPGGSFDVVLSTQVLEHVPEPERYLAECFRLLRPGGSLVLSTHGIMYYHRDPEDYWRWTCAGLRRVLAAQGFTVVELRGLLGIGAAALQIFQDGTYWFLPRFLRRLYALAMQVGISLVDRLYTDAMRAENSWTIAVRAVKPPA